MKNRFGAIGLAAVMLTAGAVGMPAVLPAFRTEAVTVAAASDFVGIWHCYKQVIDGQITEDSSGQEMFYVLEKGGTGRWIIYDGMPSAGSVIKWTAEGSTLTISFPEFEGWEPTVMTLKNGELVQEEHELMGMPATVLQYFKRIDSLPDYISGTEPPVQTTVSTTSETTAVQTTSVQTTAVQTTSAQTTAPATTSAPSLPVLLASGDANCDGTVTLDDAKLIENNYKSELVGMGSILNEEGRKNADVNKDDSVDMIDAELIKLLLEGKATYDTQIRTGDLNGDNLVTVSDAILLARIVAEDKTVHTTDEMIAAADMDGDGFVTSQDMTALVKQIAGIQ